MPHPAVSIIIVTFNNEKVIKPCLQRLHSQTYQDYEVIVVDNDSKDLTTGIIESFPWVKLVKSPSNRGFTGGNILGLQYASGDYIALLNPDTEASPEWLESLMQGMKFNSEVGLCASKLIAYDSGLIDSAGDGCVTTGRGFKRGEGEDSKLFSNQEYIFSACGGAMLIRRAVIDQIGFLDDDYFLIHEDTDFAFRAQLAGWKCLYVPEAVVYHKVRSSIGINSELAVYYSIRNAHYVWLKNMPGWLMFKYFHHQILQEVGSFLFFAVKHRKFGIYYKANIDFLKNIPSLLEKRRGIQKSRKIADYELEQMLTPLLRSDLFVPKIKKLFA